MKHLLIFVLLLSAIFSTNAQHPKLVKASYGMVDDLRRPVTDSSFKEETYINSLLIFARKHSWNMTLLYDSASKGITATLMHGLKGDPDNVLIVKIGVDVICQLESLKKSYVASMRNEMSHAGILFWIDDMGKVPGTEIRVYRTTWHEFYLPKNL